MNKLGVRKSELVRTKNLMRAINWSKVELMETIIVKFSGVDKNNNFLSSKQVVYITESCRLVYLSRETCEQLELISSQFPTIGEHSEVASSE